MPGSQPFEFNSLEDDCHFSVRILYRASIAPGADSLTLLAERTEHGFEYRILAGSQKSPAQMPFALCTACQELGSRLCEPSSLSAAATCLKNLISVLLRVAGQKVGFRANVKLFILNRAPGRISNRAGARKKYSDLFVVR
jgi:hypothetical protein